MGMNMRKNLMDVYTVLNSDEDLLRLLYYKSSNFSNSPLDPSKPNILDMSVEQKWNIINDVIVPGMKVDDLSTEEKCRIMIFMGDRNGLNNDSYSSQNVTIDVLTHITIDNIDFRLCWICDQINKLLFGENITGLSKIKLKNGKPFNAPQGYVGYRIIFYFTDFQ